MEFGFSSDQEQLKAQVRRFLDSECPLERVRTIMASKEPHDTGLWKKMAELGWPALTIPEEFGGLGRSWEDLVILAEEAGRSLCPSPILANAAAARAIAALGSVEQQEKWLPQIASGELIASLAVLEESDDLTQAGVEATAIDSVLTGRKMFVPWGQAVDLLLIAVREEEGISLYAVPSDAEGITVTPLRMIDATSRAAEVVLDGVRVSDSQRLGGAGTVWRELEKVLDAATVALAAEMVGAADAALRLATEYAKVRKQFGQYIGKFQGVKHRLAEIFVDVESARSLVYFASWAVDNVPDARAHVSMAKAYASIALDRAGEDGIQIHGAVGFTWECDAHLYYKRGRYCRSVDGSVEYHHERLLTVQGL
ncbi:MAG TPA: acyl-CoA dehydrogenase family protein [Candidatus Limnocylindrales bacterium]|nr:acyl-CoA dehydrogenase family protein [Candidatus Limnocylindrales bacterium]